MRTCFVNAFRRFSRILSIPEREFAKRCRSQQVSAFGVEIHRDTFFLSGIRDKLKAILFIHPVDLESPAFIRPFHRQTASAPIGELHVHKAFQIRRPDIILCSCRKRFFLGHRCPASRTLLLRTEPRLCRP